jgi:acyl-CoA thioesterase
MSVENAISYPAPVHPGDTLTARAAELSAGRRIAFYEVRVSNQRDETVALFRGTAYRTSQEHPLEEPV